MAASAAAAGICAGSGSASGSVAVAVGTQRSDCSLCHSELARTAASSASSTSIQLVI